MLSRLCPSVIPKIKAVKFAVKLRNPRYKVVFGPPIYRGGDNASGVARILLKGGTGAWRTGSEVRGEKSFRSESHLALNLQNLRAFATKLQGAPAPVPHTWRRYWITHISDMHFYRATACNATRNNAVAIVSVRPSVCLSFCQTRVL